MSQTETNENVEKSKLVKAVKRLTGCNGNVRERFPDIDVLAAIADSNPNIFANLMGAATAAHSEGRIGRPLEEGVYGYLSGFKDYELKTFCTAIHREGKEKYEKEKVKSGRFQAYPS